MNFSTHSHLPTSYRVCFIYEITLGKIPVEKEQYDWLETATDAFATVQFRFATQPRGLGAIWGIGRGYYKKDQLENPICVLKATHKHELTC